MTCQELVWFLMDYLDGVLSEPQRACFEEHLAECLDCVAYLATYQEAIQIGRNMCRDDQAFLPAEVPSELVEAILSARRR